MPIPAVDVQANPAVISSINRYCRQIRSVARDTAEYWIFGEHAQIEYRFLEPGRKFLGANARNH